jgi:hypothetical protein
MVDTLLIGALSRIQPKRPHGAPRWPSTTLFAIPRVSMDVFVMVLRSRNRR